MTNKVLFFSIDRLGDYLIRSNVIYSISKHYKSSEIVCSNLNYKLIKKQPFFKTIYLFDKSKKKIKLKFILQFIFKKYDAIISFDGKNISNILIFLIRSNFKYVFIYKKYGFFNNIKNQIYLLLLKLFNINYEILYSRKLIELVKTDHYPTKYRSLNKYFSNINNDTYHIENFECKEEINFDEKFILIHLDEKFNDIIDINNNFTEALNSLSLISNKKIILTSYKNYNEYYKNLNIKKFPFKSLEQINLIKDKIYVLEDIPLLEFYYLIRKSDINVSCHGGFFVHASLYNNKKTIDLIGLTDEKWLNTWVTKKNNYKLIYKSDLNKKFDIRSILMKLNHEIK